MPKKITSAQVKHWATEFVAFVLLAFVALIVFRLGSCVYNAMNSPSYSPSYSPSCAKCGSTRGYYQDSAGHALAPRYFSRCKDCDAVK